MEAKRTLVRTWLIKAQHDLATAHKLSSGPKPHLLDTAIYHCQQAAEKATKGFLVFHDQRFEKTHDIRLLVTLAELFEPKFSTWFDVAERLTPYATAFRYPDEMLEPMREEFDQALESAEGFYQFVLSVLPEDVRP